MRLIILLTVALCCNAAVAQQQAPDPLFLQRALASVEQQRNLALNAQAVAEARAATLTDDLAKANAKIKELTDSATKPKE